LPANGKKGNAAYKGQRGLREDVVGNRRRGMGEVRHGPKRNQNRLDTADIENRFLVSHWWGRKIAQKGEP